MNGSAQVIAADSGRKLTICLGVSAVLLTLFLILGLGIAAGWPVAGFDRATIAVVQMLPNPPFEPIMVFATYLASWQVVVAGTATFVIILVIERRAAWAWTLLISVVGDEIIVSATKAVFLRVRPDQALALMPAAGNSFPSGHTFAALSFYGVLASLAFERFPRGRGAVAAIALLLFILVGGSRIYLGAHWPSDVLGSYLLGGAWLSLVLAILTLLESRLAWQGYRMTRGQAAFSLAIMALWLGIVVTMNYLHPGLAEL